MHELLRVVDHCEGCGRKRSIYILKGSQNFLLSDDDHQQLERTAVKIQTLNHWSSLSNGPSEVGVSHSSPENGNRQTSETLCSSMVFTLPDHG
jgi:hypothetical protein